MTYISPAAQLIVADAHHRGRVQRTGTSYCRRSLNAADQRRNRLVRELAGVHSSCPVQYVPGTVEPHESGDGWHYRTSGGTLIRHPSAYARAGWSNMHYIPSSRCAVVGIDWPGLRIAS